MNISVYPFIDPKVHYDAQTFAGKVVLITGASRGIGLETTLNFARAGASLVIVARNQEALNASKDAILRERPSAKVLTFPADVRDVKKVAEAVAATVARFGRLDVLVANAATLRPSFERMSRRDVTRRAQYTTDFWAMTSFRKRRPNRVVGCARNQYSRDVQLHPVKSPQILADLSHAHLPSTQLCNPRVAEDQRPDRGREFNRSTTPTSIQQRLLYIKARPHPLC